MMSNHGFKGSGGGGEPRDPKLDTTVRLPAQQTAHILQQPVVPSELLKAGYQTVKTAIVNRPIAPAPVGGTITGHPSLPGAQVIAHNLIAKVPTVVGSHLDSSHVQAAGNIKAHPATVSLSTLSATHTPSGGALNLQTPASIQPTGVQMASLIRSGALPGGSTLAPSGVSLSHHAPSTGAITQAQAASHVTTISPPLIHAFPSHIPRGAAAASALSAPKPGAMATAVLRPATPATTIHMSYSGAHAAQGSTPRLPINAQLPRTYLPVRPTTPTTPPVTRPNSPASLHTQEGHRPLVGSTAISSAQTGTVQITIQQPKALTLESTSRPLLTQLTAAPKHMIQPLAGTTQHTLTRPAAQPVSQKVIMTTTAAHTIHTSTTSHSTATAKLIAGPGSTYSLSHGMQRPQKILVSQPPGASPLLPQQPVPQASLQPTPVSLGHAKTLTTNVKQQKIIMNPSSAMAALQATSSHSASTGASPVLSLSHPLSRQSKMIVSQHVTLASQSLKNANTIAAHPKQGPPVVTVPNPAHLSNIAMATSTAAPSASSLPIAKVPPQRQISASPHQVSMETSRVETAPPATGAGIFIPQQHHRSSPSPAVPTTTPAVSLPPGYLEARAQERPNVPFTYQNLSEFYGPSALVNYSNLLTPHLTAYAQQLTSLPQGPLRGVLPTQTPNLAATLQAATAQGVTLSSAAPGVRPMMVTVDPSRHPTLPVHTPQFTTSNVEGAELRAHQLSNSTVPAAPLVNAQPAAQPPPAPSPSNNITASPRPSILRKRTNDGVTVVKKNLLGQLSEVCSDNLSHSLPLASPKSSSIHDPSRENSQSSTDTATSTESTPQPPTTPELKIKQEPGEGSENGSVSLSTPGTPSLLNNMEASPRKKPRKQLLNATEDVKEEVSTDDEVEQFSSKAAFKAHMEKVATTIKQEELSEYVDDDGIRWVAERKRPNISLLNHYQITWKPRNNHFLKHTDVKPKEERRPTVNELSNQRGIIQKASGWKLYHLAAQLEDMVDMEKDINRRMMEVQESIAPKHIANTTIEDDIGMVHELTQGNILRTQHMCEQLQDARTAMIKVLDHKKRINEIVQKHHSKRPVKKKERS